MIKRKQPKILEPADLLTIPVASKQLGAGYSRNSILRRIESGEWERASTGLMIAARALPVGAFSSS